MKFFTIFNNYRNNIFIFSIFIISLIIESCGTSYVSVPVKKPAEVNMSAYRQMTVGKFVNSYKGYYEEHKYDDYIPSKIINALTSSKMVEVVDRENLDKVLAEKGLSVEGLVGGKSGQAGNIIPATALITGTVLINDFREETKDNSYTDKGKRYTSYQITSHANVKVSFRITDLITGKIVYTVEIDKTKDDSRSTDDKYRASTNSTRLLEDAREMVVTEFLHKILPYEEKVSVPFKTENDEFDRGISNARAGLWKEAIDIFHKLTTELKDKEKLAKAFFNLGLCYQYNYLFKEAEDAYKQADANYHEEIYLEYISKNRKMEDDNNRLKEQTK